MDRRTFVKTLAGLAGAAAVPLRTSAQLRAKTDALPAGTLEPAPAVLQRPAPAPTSTSTATSTSSSPAASTSSKPKAGYASGPLSLLLDGAFAGALASVEGGDARAEVVLEPLGADGLVRKNLGSPSYSNVTVELIDAPSGATAKWIQAMLERKSVRHDGGVLSVDLTGAQPVQREFFDALLTAVTFPALDAGDASAVRTALTFAPERTRFAPGDASKLPAVKGSAKVLRGANFRLSIDGLESACARVSKIEALTFKQKVAEENVGAARMPARTSGTLELPDLVITVADAHAQPFYDWHEEVVIKGNAERGEKSGKLELMNATLKDVLMTLSFQGLCVYEVRPRKIVANGSEPRRTQVSMYFERVTLK